MTDGVVISPGQFNAGPVTLGGSVQGTVGDGNIITVNFNTSTAHRCPGQRIAVEVNFLNLFVTGIHQYPGSTLTAAGNCGIYKTDLTKLRNSHPVTRITFPGNGEVTGYTGIIKKTHIHTV